MTSQPLTKFDFGPKPIKGVAAYTNPGLSFGNSVVSALPALAGGIASMSQGTLGNTQPLNQTVQTDFPFMSGNVLSNSSIG